MGKEALSPWVGTDVARSGCDSGFFIESDY